MIKLVVTDCTESLECRVTRQRIEYSSQEKSKERDKDVVELECEAIRVQAFTSWSAGDSLSNLLLSKGGFQITNQPR